MGGHLNLFCRECSGVPTKPGIACQVPHGAMLLWVNVAFGQNTEYEKLGQKESVVLIVTVF